MNDFDKAVSNVGNRFDMVLIASERMREIHKQRKDKEDKGLLSLSQRRSSTPPCVQAISDIETKIVGREYLERIRNRRKG